MPGTMTDGALYNNHPALRVGSSEKVALTSILAQPVHTAQCKFAVPVRVTTAIAWRSEHAKSKKHLGRLNVCKPSDAIPAHRTTTMLPAKHSTVPAQESETKLYN